VPPAFLMIQRTFAAPARTGGQACPSGPVGDSQESLPKVTLTPPPARDLNAPASLPESFRGHLWVKARIYYPARQPCPCGTTEPSTNQYLGPTIEVESVLQAHPCPSAVIWFNLNISNINGLCHNTGIDVTLNLQRKAPQLQSVGH
jgi:hypothetical protein